MADTAFMPAKNTKRKKSVVVNFRITVDLYKQLERYANSQTDESGQKLGVGMAARRLVLSELQKILDDSSKE